ncbi:MAG: hydantoinase/oxoprolinase family protein, partial [Alphaproteobacteria bacterium]|nr:hydantoinase/oxoprolinase family protein [Alphaproteobacteria bacterium]
SVGAGCGSIVWVDNGGMLRVGPNSAGADPGPACYRRGGKRPTITDAHVIRGTIRPEAFLGGAMSIDATASAEAFAELAQRFGVNLPDMAESVIGLAIGNIVRAIQLVSTERGRDPRDYVLVAFGGAGPLHAAKIAEDLGIDTILVPPYAGVISAYGLLAADYRIFETMTKRLPVDDAAPGQVRDVFQAMSERASVRLRELGLDPGRAALTLTAEMRFLGQAFEVPVDLSAEDVARVGVGLLVERFAIAHHRVYRHDSSNRLGTEIVSFRLGAVVAESSAPPLRINRDGPSGAVRPHRIYEGKQSVEAHALARAALHAGQRIDGPAVLDDPTSTIHVPPGWYAACDEHDNLLIRRNAA